MSDYSERDRLFAFPGRTEGGEVFTETLDDVPPEHAMFWTGMSLRQYAAIHLRVPDSGLPWLDEMIDRARRDEFAGKAMADGFFVDYDGPPDSVAAHCVRIADALIVALENGVEP